MKTHFYYPEEYHIKTVELLEGKGQEGGRGGRGWVSRFPPPRAVRCHRDVETEWRGRSLCGDDTRSKLEMSR